MSQYSHSKPNTLMIYFLRRIFVFIYLSSRSIIFISIIFFLVFRRSITTRLPSTRQIQIDILESRFIFTLIFHLLFQSLPNFLHLLLHLQLISSISFFILRFLHNVSSIAWPCFAIQSSRELSEHAHVFVLTVSSIGRCLLSNKMIVMAVVALVQCQSRFQDGIMICL